MTSASISKAEKSYIQAGLLTSPPRRADGRYLHDFRAIYLETGVAPLSNGSARLSIGRNPLDGSGGTEVLAAVKLEVENIEEQTLDGGRIACNVSCSPSAYPHLSSGALDDLQHDLTTVLHQTLSHPSLHPKNLGIIPRKKSWLLNLDLLVTAEAGNIYDALFLAARAALWDTKVPRTRSVEYKTPKTFLSASGDMDVDQDTRSGFDTRHVAHATDFELPDYWDEGEILEGRERWPVAVTLNLLHTVHFLDATLQEEASCASRLLVVYSHESPTAYTIQSMRMLGSDELSIPHLKKLIKEAEGFTRSMATSLTTKLEDEDFRRNQKAREKFGRRK
ncbi:MAG: ribosomal protein S5 domain 2-type protein [Lentinula lateritia]|uniref:Ribosomal RNA-processing protein 42 n=1 Tax=Lentinula lateritia TaxID=40482 RepID=A0ABQ8VDA9_9AGAR|nr:MAG: ribosomal protein S5 domain 2-type protein [Lentinula lateritia]KAJ4489129.1 ribosomal protein S5 domain 2-type protein [Lentinula lateritia]